MLSRAITARLRLSTAAAAAAICLLPAVGASTAGAAGPFIPPQTFPDGGAFDVAAGGSGSAAIVYGSGSGIAVSVRSPGSKPSARSARGFGATTLLGEDLQTGDLIPQAAVDGAGNVTVIWGEDYDGYNWDLFSAYKPVGQEWSPEQKIGTFYLSRGDSHVRPQLVVANGGRAAILADGGLWEREAGETSFTITPNTSFPVEAIGMNAAGTLAAIGPDQYWTTDPINLMARIKVAGGAWGSPTAIGRFAPTSHADFVIDPAERVAVTDNGKVIALWSSTTGTISPDTGGMTRYLTSRVWTPSVTGGGWAAERRLTADTYEFEIFGELHLDGPGRATASWYNTDDSQLETALPGTSPPKVSYELRPFAVAPAPSYRALLFATTDGIVTARVRASADVAFGPSQNVSEPASEHRPGVAALDEQGNGYVATSNVGTGRVDLYGYDPVAPVLTSLVVPATATVGATVTMSVVPVDRMSNPRPNWKFGDGTSTNDSTVTHAYTKAGTYTVTVSATDEAGNTGTATKTIVVSAAALPKLEAKPALWTPSYANGRTLVRTLELYDLKVGDTVKLACTGTGCTADGTRTFTVSAATAKLVTYLNGQSGMSLATGATFKVTVGRAGTQAQTATFTMQAGKAPTKVITY